MKLQKDTIQQISTLIPPIEKLKNKFYLKIRGCTSTHNGNGHKIWSLDYAFFRKRGYKTLFTQILGNGDNGDRCAGE